MSTPNGGRRPWPDVDVNEYGQMTCPIPRCDADLYLIRHYSIPLIAEQDVDLDPEHATSSSWEVECVNGHRLHDNVDQARQMNADGGDEDEAGDDAPAYDHRLTHQRINMLGGERL